MDNTKSSTVPFIGELITKLNIKTTVLNAFYSLVPQPTDASKVSNSYVGSLRHYNSPFQIRVYDAFPLMIDWEWLEYQRTTDYFEKYNISSEDIEFYLKKYGEGFVKGYYSFQKDVVESRTTIFKEPSDVQQAIFDHATGLFSRSGFPLTFGGERHILSEWTNAGIEAGYFYRSWYLILENSVRFESLFTNINSNTTDNFIKQFVKGIAELQKHDESEYFIKDLKSNVKNDEAAFRNWFRTYFSGHFNCEAESLKGNGRIDLKITGEQFGTKIVEFKGWWNIDKHQIASQLIGYLTDFEDTGYIVLVNHLKTTDIKEPYKQFITSSNSNYQPNSWKEIIVPNTSFIYYCSAHQFGNKVKTINHFIYRLFP